MFPAADIAELARRRRERIAVVVLTALLVVFTAVEVYLLRLSAKLPFVNSIFFFGLMNLNIVLVMVLLFLVFRNAVKLILDERRGRVGSRLKTRLVFLFILFAIVPTIFLFTISALYIKNSFDKWFNLKIGSTLQRSIEVVKNYYENTESNASNFARKIALSFDSRFRTPESFERKLQDVRAEYGLDGLEYYATPFAVRVISAHPDRAAVIPQVSLSTLQKAFSGTNECKIQNIGSGELVRCGAYLGVGKGVIFTSYFIPMDLASQLSEITLTYADYKTDNPLNYPIKSTYFTILSMITLLILFTATWTGFYVAKRLTVPIEELCKGTEEVSQGNLAYVIPRSGSDEMHQLIDSFNQMMKDLYQNKKDIETTHDNLQRVNEELSRRGKYIEVLLESVQSGVISLDENGKISMLNPAAAKLLRISPDEWIGKPYWAIVPEDRRQEFRDLLITVYGTSKPLRRELKLRANDGQWVTLLVTLSVLREEGKGQLGVVAVLDDLTEIQKVERMIAWREVAKRIAHEIKNPLTPIQLSVQRLRRRYLDKIQDDGTFGSATDIILKEVDSLKTLVSEFSSFARLPEIHQEPNQLNEITLEAVSLFRAAHEKIRFELELAEALPEMLLDRSQIKRILINLFDNAVAAMQGAGIIWVSTEFDSSERLVKLTVRDEGCGIAEADQAMVFEPHFSRKAEGTGLGLAIVHRIVTDHGGFVRVTKNEPKGTQFTVEFPERLIVVSEVAKTDSLNEGTV